MSLDVKLRARSGLKMMVYEVSACGVQWGLREWMRSPRGGCAV